MVRFSGYKIGAPEVGFLSLMVEFLSLNTA
jgi:hypothetical protein